MGSKTSVIIYITLALLLLLLISHSPNKPSSHRRRHRRLKLRSNFSAADHQNHHQHHHEPVPFDPLVADIERKIEDRQWEKEKFINEGVGVESAAPGAESQPEWEDFMNAEEDYLNDEEKFNVTDRLVLLFPKIDVDPTDGYATGRELVEWILKNSQREVMHRTQREMELHDKNRDGFVSFAEYQPPSWVNKSGVLTNLLICQLVHLFVCVLMKL